MNKQDARDVANFGEAVIEALKQQPESKPKEFVADRYEIRHKNFCSRIGIWDLKNKRFLSTNWFDTNEQEVAQDFCVTLNIGHKLRNKMES